MKEGRQTLEFSKEMIIDNIERMTNLKDMMTDTNTIKQENSMTNRIHLTQESNITNSIQEIHLNLIIAEILITDNLIETLPDQTTTEKTGRIIETPLITEKMIEIIIKTLLIIAENITTTDSLTEEVSRTLIRDVAGLLDLINFTSYNI